MKKILAVLTGGTIGSSMKNGIISADAGSSAIEAYKKIYGDDTSFTVIRPMNFLSENLNKRHWEKLVNTLLSMSFKDYDGIIITHGSDTLSYSSSMLSMCLSGIDKPVIITASNLVPDHPESNAAVNLRAAVVMINTVSQGIFTVYKNPCEKYCSVYIPTRIREADRYLGSFSCFEGTPFGRIENDSFVQLSKGPSLSEIENHKPVFTLTEELCLSKEIMLIRPYPSMRYDDITLSKELSAVLHVTYHSSTACSEKENSALSLLLRCRESGIPFYLASFRKDSSSMYETSDVLLKNGALPMFDISDEAAYARLLLYYSLGFEQELSSLPDFYFETIK